MPDPRRESAPGETDVELLAAAQVSLNRHAEVLRGLGQLFADHGHELYLVGGSVRDALLGRLGADLDFTTDARPEQMQRFLRGWADALWDTGIEFGTLGVGKGADRLELTTFRADTYDQVSRNPEVRFGDNLADDLGEKTDLASQLPGLARSLDRQLGRWLEKTGAAMPRPTEARQE